MYCTAFSREHLSKTIGNLSGLETHFSANLFQLTYLCDSPLKQKSVNSYKTFDSLL